MNVVLLFLLISYAGCLDESTWIYDKIDESEQKQYKNDFFLKSLIVNREKRTYQGKQQKEMSTFSTSSNNDSLSNGTLKEFFKRDKRQPNITTRNVPNYDYPFIISFYFMQEDGVLKPFGCAGTIIGIRHVITAAHCLINLDFTKIKIHTGNRVMEIMVRKDETLYDILHNEIYHDGNHAIDIAADDLSIVITTTTFRLAHNVMIIRIGCLYNRRDFIFPYWGCTGIGYLNHSNVYSNFLNAKTMRKVHFQKCYDSLMDFVEDPVFLRYHHHFICAEDMDGFGSSTGASGSPLVYMENSVPNIVGVLSGGRGCTLKYPALFMNIRFYRPWIERILNMY